ncbi:hypothetical protein QM334_37955, partial [Burkholderia cenocepacia]|nr:hypothetical protein [Burkholderia cenocepacia]
MEDRDACTGAAQVLRDRGATLIGAAVAQDLSRAGACVAILDLDADNGARVAASLGERALFLAL